MFTLSLLRVGRSHLLSEMFHCQLLVRPSPFARRLCWLPHVGLN